MYVFVSPLAFLSALKASNNPWLNSLSEAVPEYVNSIVFPVVPLPPLLDQPPVFPQLTRTKAKIATTKNAKNFFILIFSS
jgi:hypothetical protein